MTKKSTQKFKYLKNERKEKKTKRAFKMKQKVFFIIFKRLSSKQIKQTFLEGEGATLFNN